MSQDRTERQTDASPAPAGASSRMSAAEPDGPPTDALPSESTSDPTARHAPVSGTCAACGCALGYVSCRRDDTWFCCGGCAGSGRCCCGCDPEFSRAIGFDRFVPTRRMFASRFPDELRGDAAVRGQRRAFPFHDRRRGR